MQSGAERMGVETISGAQKFLPYIEHCALDVRDTTLLISVVLICSFSVRSKGKAIHGFRRPTRDNLENDSL